MYHRLRVKRVGNKVKYQARSVHLTKGKWHDYKACDDLCQAVTITPSNNKPFTSDIFITFDKPYVIPALPLTDGKEAE